MEAIDLLIDSIWPNPDQPRKSFSVQELKSLGQSIQENSLIQPVVVYKNGDGFYHLIDGERRWRAAKMIGMKYISSVVRDGPPQEDEKGLLATVANMQREDLTPIEEATAMQQMKDKGMSTTVIAHRLGISYPKVANRLALLKLDQEIQELINQGKMATDRRVTDALLSIEDPEHRVKLASKLARTGVNIQSVVTACEKFNAALQSQPAGEHVPSLHYAAKHSGKVDLPKWNILKQAGKVPPWSEVEKAATTICDRCPLRETASSVVCKDCPAVLMISQMIKQAGA